MTILVSPLAEMPVEKMVYGLEVDVPEVVAPVLLTKYLEAEAACCNMNQREIIRPPEISRSQQRTSAIVSRS